MHLICACYAAEGEDKEEKEVVALAGPCQIMTAAARLGLFATLLLAPSLNVLS